MQGWASLCSSGWYYSAYGLSDYRSVYYPCFLTSSRSIVPHVQHSARSAATPSHTPTQIHHMAHQVNPQSLYPCNHSLDRAVYVMGKWLGSSYWVLGTHTLMLHP